VNFTTNKRGGQPKKATQVKNERFVEEQSIRILTKVKKEKKKNIVNKGKETEREKENSIYGAC